MHIGESGAMGVQLKSGRVWSHRNWLGAMRFGLGGVWDEVFEVGVPPWSAVSSLYGISVLVVSLIVTGGPCFGM